MVLCVEYDDGTAAVADDDADAAAAADADAADPVDVEGLYHIRLESHISTTCVCVCLCSEQHLCALVSKPWPIHVSVLILGCLVLLMTMLVLLTFVVND